MILLVRAICRRKCTSDRITFTRKTGHFQDWLLWRREGCHTLPLQRVVFQIFGVLLPCPLIAATWQTGRLHARRWSRISRKLRNSCRYAVEREIFPMHFPSTGKILATSTLDPRERRCSQILGVPKFACLSNKQ